MAHARRSGRRRSASAWPRARIADDGVYGPVVSYDFYRPAGRKPDQDADARLPAQRGQRQGAVRGVDVHRRVVGLRDERSSTRAGRRPSCRRRPCRAAWSRPQPAKLQVSRATISKSARTIDILAPITQKGDRLGQARSVRGRPALRLDGGDRLDRRRDPQHARDPDGPGQQGNGDPDDLLRGQRGALGRRSCGCGRPTCGPTSTRRGRRTRPACSTTRGRSHRRRAAIVRVQLQYFSGGTTTTLEFHAPISNGAWSLTTTLTAAQQAAIAARSGTLHSYILFTGYLPRKMRGEMDSYQVLGAP